MQQKRRRECHKTRHQGAEWGKLAYTNGGIRDETL
jgi:hypothetical protein